MYTASTRDLDSGLIFYENYVTIAFIWETDVQLFPGREPLELISFVKGTVADIVENCLIVENGGLGYEIYMTGREGPHRRREKNTYVSLCQRGYSATVRLFFKR